MNKLQCFFGACVGMAMVSCGDAGRSNTDAELGDTVVQQEVHAVDGHNAKNALDYLGTYEGVVPCADCEGIKTRVQLLENDAFVMTTNYLGKANAEDYKETGTFKWDDAGQVISLDNGVDVLCKFFVGENTLTQLDTEGEKIEGALADKYILKKE